VHENRVLRIFGAEGEEVAREWRKLHNEELHNLYSLSNSGEIKSRWMSWVGLLTYTREEGSSYKVLVGKPESKKPLLRLGRDMRMILRWL
jgi:hypothetical protein